MESSDGCPQLQILTDWHGLKQLIIKYNLMKINTDLIN